MYEYWVSGENAEDEREEADLIKTQIQVTVTLPGRTPVQKSKPSLYYTAVTAVEYT